MATWILVLACLTDGATDPSSVSALIERLGSPRFAEREAASDALAALGPEALRALRSARGAGDPEIQNRVEGVIDRIERNQLRQPTRVTLAPKDEPLGLVLRAIQEQTEFPFELEVGARSNWLSRRISWPDEEVLTFWEALDRLGLDGTWLIDRDVQRFSARSSPVFRLSERRDRTLSSHDGPFRFVVREWRPAFGAPDSSRLLGPALARARPGLSDQPVSELQLELMCEPRLLMRLCGPPRILEAVDARGKDRVPQELDVPAIPLDSMTVFNPSIPFTAYLALGEPSQARLTRLRGQVPIEVSSRRMEPTEIPLVASGEPPPSPVWCGELTFVSCRMLESPFNTSTIELTIQPDGWNQMMMLMMFRRRFRRDFPDPFSDIIERVMNNVEVVDAEGRVLAHTSTRPWRPLPDGFHLLLSLAPEPDTGPPRLVRYYGTVRDTMTLSFEFRDVTMPTAAGR